MGSEQLINKFYSSFQKRDWVSMQACYHPEAHFDDPVFNNLKGKEVLAMWHMLLSNAKDLKIIYSQIEASEGEGKCHWEAFYSFPKTGRQVHNKIDAQFKFKDNLIFDHKDHFDLWRWSSMALGLSGLLLGWSGFLKRKIRHTAKKSLRRFIEKNEIYL